MNRGDEISIMYIKTSCRNKEYQFLTWFSLSVYLFWGQQQANIPAIYLFFDSFPFAYILMCDSVILLNFHQKPLFIGPWFLFYFQVTLKKVK